MFCVLFACCWFVQVILSLKSINVAFDFSLRLIRSVWDQCEDVINSKRIQFTPSALVLSRQKADLKRQLFVACSAESWPLFHGHIVGMAVSVLIEKHLRVRQVESDALWMW